MTKSSVESLESRLHQTTDEKEHMDHSLNEQINTLQSNLSSLQHDKQTSEEQLQEQISKLKVRKGHLDHSLNEQINTAAFKVEM